VDVTGRSKGRGFAGVVKRHHFRGGPKTHGQSDRHRAPGSVGSTTFPGRVLKGQRMAGHMGDQRLTVRNLEVVAVDPERHLLFVQGAVPGPANGLLVIRRAKAPRR
jgi:large subunit ribosomal protein L3